MQGQLGFASENSVHAVVYVGSRTEAERDK